MGPDGIFQILQAKEQYGLYFVMAIIALFIAAWLGYSWLKKFVEAHIQKINHVDVLFQSFCDPDQPQKTYKIHELVGQLVQITEKLDLLSDQLEEVEKRTEVTSRQVVEFKDAGEKARQETKELIKEIAGDVKAVTNELFALVRTFIGRTGNTPN